MSRKKTTVEEFDPHRVRPLPGQPRKRFKGIPELAAAIAEVGQRVPGIVTLVQDDPKYDAQLVDGERRIRACRMAGVPFRAEVIAPAQAEEIFVSSFAANFGKQDHDAIEIAHALERMRTAGGKTLKQLGAIAGKSGTWVAQHLSFLKLHPDVQGMMVSESDDEDDAPRLSWSIALLLVQIEDPAKQLKLAQRIAKGDGMSMVAARRLVLRERMEAEDPRLMQSGCGSGTGKRMKLDSIDSIAEDITDRIGIYLDMPGPQINAMIDRADASTKRQIIKSLQEAQDDLQALSERIRERLPKMRSTGAAA